MIDETKIRQVFTKNLNRFLSEKQVPQNELAKYLGVSNTTINNWVKGYKMPRMDKIDKICSFFSINRSELLEEYSSKTKQIKGIKIPILGRVVAGIPIEAITDIDGYEEITPKLAATGSFFALHIKGDSMAPYMLPNDIVIVRCQEDVDCGNIAIILVNGDEATVKKVQKSKEGITLIGMNPSVYAPHFYTNQEILELPVKVIGKVVEIRRPLP